MTLPSWAALLLTGGVVLLTACDKEGDDNLQNAGTLLPQIMDTIQVREAVTGLPVAGARVTLEACSKYDFVFGCLDYSPIKTYTTDSNGHALVDRALKWEIMEVTRNNYWPAQLKKGRTVAPYPVCYLKVRVVKSRTLRPAEGVYVAAKPPCNPWCFEVFTYLGQPADTTVFLQGYGNIENAVLWDIRSKDSAYMYVNVQQSPPVYIKRFDMGEVVINY